jgi:lysozyme family protein
MLVACAYDECCDGVMGKQSWAVGLSHHPVLLGDIHNSRILQARELSQMATDKRGKERRKRYHIIEAIGIGLPPPPSP